MQVWWLFPIKFFDFFEYMQVRETWGSPNLHILKKDQHFDAKCASNLHILKIIKNFDSEKPPNLHILKKIKKNQKLIHLCQSVPHSVWIFCFFYFFEYMQAWWLFTIKCFDFFQYMQVWWLLPIKFFDFFEYMQVRETWGSPNLHILKKDQHFDAKCASNLHILKIIKNVDSEKPPNLHILKKNQKYQKLIHLCQSVPHRVWNFWFFWFFCVYAWFGGFSLSFFIFEYVQVLCTFGIKMLILFEYMQVWWTSSLKPTFLQPSNDMILFNFFPLSISI